MNTLKRYSALRTILFLVLLLVMLALGNWQNSRYKKVHAFRSSAATNVLDGNFPEAISALDEAIRLNPRDAQAHFDRASAHVLNKQFKEAISDYSEVIRLDPRNAQAYLERGRAHVLNKDFHQGINDFSEALRRDPGDARAWYTRGATYAALGDHEKSITDFTESLRIAPTNINCYLRRSSAFLARKRWDEALDDCNNALRLDPANARAYSARGVAYKKKGDFEKALKDLQEGIRLSPKDWMVQEKLALFRSSCPDAAFRNGPEAVKLAAKACELSEWKSWHCVSTLAAAHAEVGDFEQAVQSQQQALGMFGATETNRAEEQHRLELYQQAKPYRDLLR